MSDDPDVNEVIKFLRQREVVHFQRFGEAILTVSNRFSVYAKVSDLSSDTLFFIKLYPFIINSAISLLRTRIPTDFMVFKIISSIGVGIYFSDNLLI